MMIQNKSDLKKFIDQDRKVNGWKEQKFFKCFVKRIIPNEIERFLYLLRMVEYYSNVKSQSKIRFFFKVYYQYRLRKQSLKLGFSIAPNSFGPGLSLPHYGTIIVNASVRVGENCRLHANTNIGASAGIDKAPRIGDNVYIGPGAIIFGDIDITNNVTIGSNATVNKSINNENVVIAGTPAKIVKENYPNWLFFNKIEPNQ